MVLHDTSTTSFSAHTTTEEQEQVLPLATIRKQKGGKKNKTSAGITFCQELRCAVLVAR